MAHTIEGFAHGRVPRDVRARQILDLADDLFAERGYGDASMAELSRRAGVAKPVIYGLFGSKDGLLTAVVRRMTDEMVADVEAAARGADGPEAQLRAGSRAFFAFVRAHPERYALLASASLTAEAARARDAFADLHRRLFAETIERDGLTLPPDGVEAAIRILLGAYESFAGWALERRDLGPDALTELYVALVWPGLDAARGPAADDRASGPPA